jgi:uncharacterized membrane protein
MREWVEWSSQGIQAMAVVIIVASIIFGSLRFLLQLSTRVTDAYRSYKRLLGRSLLLSLEFLVAADVIRTVLLDLTAKGMEILGALVVVRTFLSWSLVLEIEGHWPWHLERVRPQAERVQGDDDRELVSPSLAGLDEPDGRAVGVPTSLQPAIATFHAVQGTKGEP